MSLLKNKNKNKVDTYSLVNAFLLSLPQDLLKTFYNLKEEDSLESQSVVVNEHIHLQGLLFTHNQTFITGLKDYYVRLAVFVDGIDTEVFRCKLDNRYYSRFRTVQDYVCTKTSTKHEIPSKIIEELNAWSKSIVLPKCEEERRKEQESAQKEKKRYEEEEQALSIYR